MCSAFTHAALGIAIARIGTGARMPVRYWVAAGLLAAAPDLDALGYSMGFGPPGESMWAHRGLTHSLVFSLATAAVVVFAIFRARMPDKLPVASGSVKERVGGWASPIARWRVWLILAAAMFSHGLTDMLTNGGSGVAVFAPVSVQRFKWAFRPVEVSPLSVGRFFGERGLVILWSELRWVVLPAVVVVVVVEVMRRWRAKSTSVRGDL